MSVRLAYHEAGHALAARFLGRRVESVAFVRGGGAVVQEPLAPNRTDEEIELGLVVVFAGLEAERYAPEVPPWQQRGDPYFTDGEALLYAVESERDEDDSRPDEHRPPSDEEVIGHYRQRIGDEAVERAREFAVEIVERMYQIGRLERLADEILFRGHLTRDDIERLLGASA